MAKSLGFYGINTANSLIQDMRDEWGEALEQMPATDTIWLLYRLGDNAFTTFTPFDQESSTEADAVHARLHELGEDELIALIQMLVANNGKPFGFWALSKDNSLIADMADEWGEALQSLSQSDRYWLIARASGHLWMIHHDQPPTDEAELVLHRADELSPTDLQGLIQALAED